MGAAFVLVETTLPRGRAGRAEAWARRALIKRWAACANVAPISSVYWWKGRIESARELLVSFKTTRTQVAALVAWIRQSHPYEVPYVGVLPLTLKEPAYRRWVEREARTTPKRRARRRP